MVPLRLLLIEDSKADAAILQKMLGDAATIEWVRSLDAAAHRLAEGAFDAILLDLSLPDSQGVESVATVRFFDSETPIVVLSGLDDDEAALQTLRQGAQDYVVKGSLDSKGLLRVVRFAKQRAEVQRKLVPPEQKAREDVLARAVACPPGADMMPALARHVQQLCDHGAVVYLSVDQPASLVLRRLQVDGDIHFIDASGQADQEEGHIHVPDDPRDLDVVALDVERAVAALGPGTSVMVDSINSLILHHGVEAAALFCHALANRLRLLRIPADFIGHRNQEWPFILDRFSFLDGEVALGQAAERSDPSIT